MMISVVGIIGLCIACFCAGLGVGLLIVDRNIVAENRDKISRIKHDEFPDKSPKEKRK